MKKRQPVPHRKLPRSNYFCPFLTDTVLINEEVPDAEVKKTVPTTTTILPSSTPTSALPTIVVPQVKQGNALLINELKKRVKDETVLAPQEDKHSDDDDDVKGIKNSVTETSEDVKFLKDSPPNQDLATKSEEQKVVPKSILDTSDHDEDDANSTKEAFVTPPNCEIADPPKEKSDIKLQNGDNQLQSSPF